MTQGTLFEEGINFPIPRDSVAKAGNHVNGAHLEEFAHRLNNAGWLKASDLRAIGPERYIRKLAEYSDGFIVSSNEGYHLTQQLSPEDVYRHTERLHSQAKKMLLRVRQCRRRIR